MTRDDVGKANFHGKHLSEMSREELMDVIGYLFDERQRDKAECAAMMRALCDQRRKRGGAYWRWLFGDAP